MTSSSLHRPAVQHPSLDLGVSCSREPANSERSVVANLREAKHRTDWCAEVVERSEMESSKAGVASIKNMAAFMTG